MAANLVNCNLCTPVTEGVVVTQNLADILKHFVTMSDGSYEYTVNGSQDGKPTYYCSSNNLYAWYFSSGNLWIIGTDTSNTSNSRFVKPSVDATLPTTGWYNASIAVNGTDSYDGVYSLSSIQYYSGTFSSIAYSSMRGGWIIPAGAQPGDPVWIANSSPFTTVLTGAETWFYME